MKTVVVIGSGNVAEALAGAIAASPYGLAQLYARNRDRGERIARSYGCPFASDPQELAPADIHLIAVSDRAVGEVAEALDFGRAVVAHTAGSVPLDGLPGKIRNRGVFYPLQTFTAGRHISLGDVPLLVEGSDPQTTRTLLRLHARSARTRGKPRRRNGRDCIWRPSSQAIFRTTCTRSPSNCSTGTDFRPIC